jgi:ATP-dependent RNA helicase A
MLFLTMVCLTVASALIDFLLVVLRDMVKNFPDMKVILMSATIDTSLFSEYFGGCPIFEVYGRMHAVQEYYLEDCIQVGWLTRLTIE